MHAALVRELAPLGGERSATHRSFDSRFGPRWNWKTCLTHRLPGGLLVHRYEAGDGITISDRAAGCCAFVAPGPSPDAEYEPARLVRELLIADLERRTAVPLHAGAVSLGGRGVLICGPRGAGKTTLICHLLEHAGADFVANDRLFAVAGRRPRAVSWPWGIRIGLDTCAASPALSRWLAGRRRLAYPQPGWDLEDPGRQPAGGGEAAKLELTAAELAAAMGARVLGTVPVDLLVDLRYRTGHSEHTVEPLDPGVVAEDMERESEHVATDVYRDWLDLGLSSRGPVTPRGREAVSALARGVPAVRLTYGDTGAAMCGLTSLLG